MKLLAWQVSEELIPLMIILGVGSVSILIALIFSIKYSKGILAVSLKQDIQDQMISFYHPITSPTKIFYLILFVVLVFQVFREVAYHAWQQWGQYHSKPDTLENQYFFSFFMLLFVILEAIHFARMYIYIHSLEEPNSDIHKKFIAPIYNRNNGHPESLLRCEQIFRLIVVALVSLKFVKEFHLLEGVGPFRFFTLYLLLFYFALLCWDIVIMISAGKKYNETYILMNAIGCMFLVILYLTSPSEKSDGTILIAIVSIVVLCGNICVSLKTGSHHEFRNFIEEIFSIVKTPNYGVPMKRYSCPSYIEDGKCLSNGRCKEDICVYKKTQNDVYVPIKDY